PHQGRRLYGRVFQQRRLRRFLRDGALYPGRARRFLQHGGARAAATRAVPKRLRGHDLARAPRAAAPREPVPSGSGGGIKSAHSITSSASASSLSGISSPSVFAVLRLSTSSNLTGCCTGSSLGLVPFSTRSP